MANKESHKNAEIIKAFLKNPLDRKAFDRFFYLCYSETMAYLRHLRSSGWKLPEDQVQLENALLDLAYDILGPFLASRRDHPYFVVFEYFERHGVVDLEQIAPESLYRDFHVLLRGFIRRELTLVRGLINPQIKKLKRRIKDILAGPDYDSKVWLSGEDESFFAVVNANRLRDDCPSISVDRLYSIVRNAFMRSGTRTDWCRRIFRLLDEETDRRNAIELHRLISEIVTVNAEFVDTTDLSMGRISTPSEDYIRRQVSTAINETMGWLESEVLNRFLNKGRLSTEEAQLILKACRTYLREFGLDGKAAEIPEYFLALKPGLSQKDYLTQYKYVMETVINRGLQDLRLRLRKDSTIWPFNNY